MLGGGSYLAYLAFGGFSGMSFPSFGYGDFATVMHFKVALLAQPLVNGYTELGSLFSAMTGNPYVDGMIVLSSLLGFGLLIKKAKDEFFGHGSQEPEQPKNVQLSNIPLPVEIVKTLATKDELREVEEDMSIRFDQVEKKIESERTTARIALGNVHKRIDKVVENTSEIKGELKQVNENLGRLLDRSLK